MRPVLFSVIESPSHPKLAPVYTALGFEEILFNSQRKTIAALKRVKPAVIVAEFFYAYASNYSSNHICNLDSLMISLQRYPDYRPLFLLFSSKRDAPHVAGFTQHYRDVCHHHHSLTHPVSPTEVHTLLKSHLESTSR